MGSNAQTLQLLSGAGFISMEESSGAWMIAPDSILQSAMATVEMANVGRWRVNLAQIVGQIVPKRLLGLSALVEVYGIGMDAESR